MCGGGPARKEVAAEKEHQGERPGRDHVVHQLVSHAAEQQKADQVHRLHQELLDLAVADLQGDAVGQVGHAGKRPADLRQQIVGHHFLVGVAGHGGLAGHFGHGREDRSPEKHLGHQRQKPHQRAQREVAPVDQPLLDRNPQDRPPGGQRRGTRMRHSPAPPALIPGSSVDIERSRLMRAAWPFRASRRYWPAKTPRRSLPRAADPRR